MVLPFLDLSTNEKHFKGRKILFVLQNVLFRIYFLGFGPFLGLNLGPMKMVLRVEVAFWP